MGSEEEPYDPLETFDVDKSCDMDHRAVAYLLAVTGHEAKFAALCAALRRNDPLVTEIRTEDFFQQGHGQILGEAEFQ
jgi:hypothetical protein